MRVAVVRSAEDGAMRSRHFATTSSRGMGVFGGAAHSLDMLAKVRPIGERDLNDCLASRNPALEFAILDELYLRALAADFRILHARRVMGRLERGRPIDQHDRHHVLQGRYPGNSRLSTTDASSVATRTFTVCTLVRAERMLLE